MFVYSMYVAYLNLSLHCYAKECNEVHDKYWPEDGHIEEVEKCTNQTY